jgi:phosphopantothenoylcysteine decarboxylase
MRAIDPARTRVYVFPAMNTFMWAHPFTQPQLDTLRKIGYTVVGPVGKKLACGDVGESG